MVLLGAKDGNIREHLNKSLGNKYTNQDIQNEILEIIADHKKKKRI